MKKFTFFFVALLFLSLWRSEKIFAQSPRMVLVEEFTNAGCPPCAEQNPDFNTLLDANTAKVVAIKFQTPGPGYDVMNEQSPNEVDTRGSYYNLSYVPSAAMDGT